jgi:hypothetical protein
LRCGQPDTAGAASDEDCLAFEFLAHDLLLVWMDTVSVKPL